MLLVAWCFAFMVLLSHRWIGMTVHLQETNRQARLARHLDWQTPVEATKAGFLRKLFGK